MLQSGVRSMWFPLLIFIIHDGWFFRFSIMAHVRVCVFLYSLSNKSTIYECLLLFITPFVLVFICFVFGALCFFFSLHSHSFSLSLYLSLSFSLYQLTFCLMLPANNFIFCVRNVSDYAWVISSLASSSQVILVYGAREEPRNVSSLSWFIE